MTLDLSYDPATPGVPQGDGVSFPVPDLRFRLVIAGVVSNPAEEPSGGWAFLIDSPGGQGSDSLGLSGWVKFSEEIALLVRLQFDDESGAAVEGAALPEVLDLSRFTSSNLEIRTGPGDGRSFLFNARVDSIDPCKSEDVLFTRAETDGDGSVTLSDAMRTLLFLFAAGAEPSCLDAVDSNDDGVVDLSDGIYTLLFLFSGGDPPPAPSDCGVDPTQDDLSCEAFAGCPRRL